jgi:hypothetical protein
VLSTETSSTGSMSTMRAAQPRQPTRGPSRRRSGVLPSMSFLHRPAGIVTDMARPPHAARACSTPSRRSSSTRANARRRWMPRRAPRGLQGRPALPLRLEGRARGRAHRTPRRPRRRGRRAMASAPDGPVAFFLRTSVMDDDPLDRVLIATSRLAQGAITPPRRRCGTCAPAGPTLCGPTSATTRHWRSSCS